MTNIVISVDDKKQYSTKLEGDDMHPIEVCKVLMAFLQQIMGAFIVPEKSKIIKPTIEVPHA